MFTIIVYLIIGFCSGFFAASWIPPFFSQGLGESISTLILNPITFFFGMFCFFIGFIANASLVRTCIEGVYAIKKGYKIKKRKMFTSFLVLGSFISLFYINISVASLLFIFSVVYGMISLDLHQNWKYEDKQEDL
jgi:hypothetical protein